MQIIILRVDLPSDCYVHLKLWQRSVTQSTCCLARGTGNIGARWETQLKTEQLKTEQQWFAQDFNPLHNGTGAAVIYASNFGSRSAKSAGQRANENLTINLSIDFLAFSLVRRYVFRRLSERYRLRLIVKWA